jgi:hypothetical protein
VKLRLVADRINELSERWSACPIDERRALRAEA